MPDQSFKAEVIVGVAAAPREFSTRFGYQESESGGPLNQPGQYREDAVSEYEATKRARHIRESGLWLTTRRPDGTIMECHWGAHSIIYVAVKVSPDA